MAWTPPSGISLKDAYYEVATKLTNQSWNQFARSGLRLDEADIQEICDNYRNDRKEQKFQMCQKWEEKVGCNASVENIYAVLNHFLFPRVCLPPDMSIGPKRAFCKQMLDSNTSETQRRNAEFVHHPPPEIVDYCSKVEKVNVVPCGRDFYERNVGHQLNYARNYGRGKVLIINNSFSHLGESSRIGCKVDIKNMEELWQQLGCTLKVELDLSAQDMLSKLKIFSDGAQTSNYCVVLVMSHGRSDNGQDVVLGNDKNPVRIQQILEMYNNKNAPQLQGIPKVFFFQCCRGDFPDVGVTVAERQPPQTVPQARLLPSSYIAGLNAGEPTDLAESGPTTDKLPTTCDMLVSYAAQSGHQAFLNTHNGSWFINAITNVFMRQAAREHILDMMIHVNQVLAEKSSIGAKYKAMSQVEFTLRKKLYLYPGI